MLIDNIQFEYAPPGKWHETDIDIHWFGKFAFQE